MKGETKEGKKEFLLCKDIIHVSFMHFGAYSIPVFIV
jgi:hypothetical protein